MILGWLHSLSDRERALMALAGVLGLAAAVFLALIEPLSQRLDHARRGLEAAQADTVWLQQKAAQMAAMGARPAAPGPSEKTPRTVAQLEADIRATALATQLTRIAPQSANQVEIAFEDVSYQGLMRWMLDRGLARAVQNLSIRHTDSADRVDASIVLDLSRSGATP
jgi:type II secretory pathway component PulM